MASNSGRRSGSSGSSKPRKRVVIDAEQTKRVEYRAETASGHKRRPDAGRRRGDTRSADRLASTPSPHAKRVSAAKREERERRQRMLRVRRAAALVAVVALATTCVWGLVAITRLPAFGVKAVTVEGTRHLDPDAVIARAQVEEGTSLIWLSKRRISRRLMADPWVRRVEIDRDFPGAVRIIVEERVPAVSIDTGGAEYLVVSSDGLWLGERSAVESDVPVVRDVELPASPPKAGTKVASETILNVIRVVGGLSDELLAITRVISAPSIEKTALITTDDVQVFVGDAQDIAKKDRIVREILRTEKGKVVYINVRVVDSPTWRGLDQ